MSEFVELYSSLEIWKVNMLYEALQQKGIPSFLQERMGGLTFSPMTQPYAMESVVVVDKEHLEKAREILKELPFDIKPKGMSDEEYKEKNKEFKDFLIFLSILIVILIGIGYYIANK